jgi:hypothetical protein
VTLLHNIHKKQFKPEHNRIYSGDKMIAKTIAPSRGSSRLKSYDETLLFGPATRAQPSKTPRPRISGPSSEIPRPAAGAASHAAGVLDAGGSKAKPKPAPVSPAARQPAQAGASGTDGPKANKPKPAPVSHAPQANPAGASNAQDTSRLSPNDIPKGDAIDCARILMGGILRKTKGAAQIIALDSVLRNPFNNEVIKINPGDRHKYKYSDDGVGDALKANPDYSTITNSPASAYVEALTTKILQDYPDPRQDMDPQQRMNALREVCKQRMTALGEVYNEPFDNGVIRIPGFTFTNSKAQQALQNDTGYKTIMDACVVAIKQSAAQVREENERREPVTKQLQTGKKEYEQYLYEEAETFIKDSKLPSAMTAAFLIAISVSFGKKG